MCIGKEEYKQLVGAVAEVKEQLREVKHDTGNIKTSQQGVTVALKDVNKHLASLNNRVSKSEQRIDNVEDPEFREVRCIQKPTIEEIREGMKDVLTVQKFEEWERKKEKEKEMYQAKKMHSELIAVQKLEARQRQMQWIISGIVGVGTIIVALITYFG
jgi:membrane-associated HD superfamily phosphohydrolase